MEAKDDVVTESDIDLFDKALSLALEGDCLEDFVKSYLTYREENQSFTASLTYAINEADFDFEGEDKDTED